MYSFSDFKKKNFHMKRNEAIVIMQKKNVHLFVFFRGQVYGSLDDFKLNE